MSKTALNWINGEWMITFSQDSITPATEKNRRICRRRAAEAERAIATAKEIHKNSDWKHNRHLDIKPSTKLAMLLRPMRID
jgi:hypothetical protein